MKIIQCGLGVVALMVTVSSCGGRTGEKPCSIERDYSGPLITDSNKELQVSDLAGIWYFNIEAEEPDGFVFSSDEFYVVINEDGEYTTYDYLGDTRANLVNNYQNCFAKSNQKIVKKMDGGFSLVSSLGPQISLSIETNYDIVDGNLVAAGYPHLRDCDYETPLDIAIPSEKSQADLESMICPADF